MGAVAAPTLRLRKLWLSIGWLLVALVVYLSLSSDQPVMANDKKADDLAYVALHLLVYGVLMLWFLQLYPASRRPIIALSLIAMGAVLEVLQGFTPDRSPGYTDAVANTVGVMLGWSLGKTRLSRALEAVDKTLMRLSA